MNEGTSNNGKVGFQEHLRKKDLYSTSGQNF